MFDESDFDEEETPSKADKKEEQVTQVEEPTTKRILGEETPRNREGEGGRKWESYENKEITFLAPLQV